MLTKEAFNALLKTLEEPPSHVIFILATTEIFKVPPTIQSRCQRFDFRLGTKDQIKSVLKNIIKQEKGNVMNDNVNFEIEEKELPTLLIAGYRMKGKYQEVDRGFKLLGKTFGRYINGKAMNLYYDGEYKEEEADFEPCFPIRKGKDTDDISVRELKGGKCVSIIHKGDYGILNNSYKKIFAYINEKGYKALLPTREVYLKGPGMIFKGNPNNYLTEIQIMIEE